ncbi:L,D-transpeptidase family protein [Pseudomonas sp. HR96]|uniref:L,D-transpeptidase family protein n=1 Tax=Pseudomonas sp. HR96 TaxID=1027966 RepID=UPI002A7631FE|nr:L,D-transpeptidase family protein [Pseudomonas sp. HR96]WPP00858.1 L,D-transpeptidase family protein [Pseudomonas sp. HR96]
MRWLLAVFCMTCASLCSAAFTQTLVTKPVDQLKQDVVIAAPVGAPGAIDKVLVLKSAHKLQLMSRGEALKTYHVSLGKAPRGPKEREGDRRTPEGFYWLDWRKTSDRFNLAIHVSYPNLHDAAQARAQNVDAGGMIMIHGTPVDDNYPEWYFNTLDWTDGCIAMKNDDMREVWGLVRDGTMIEIRP